MSVQMTSKRWRCLTACSQKYSDCTPPISCVSLTFAFDVIVVNSHCCCARDDLTFTTVRQAPNPATLPLDTTAISVRQNDSVAVYASTIHYDNEIFPDPFTFQWDRFYDEGSGGCKKFYKDGREVRYPLFAFGGGETMCKGRYFVRNENKIAFLAILIALDVEMYHKDDVNERGELKASTSPNNIPEGKFPVSNTKAGGSGIVPPLDKDALVIRFRRRHGDEAIDGKRGMHQ
eukprot:gb/GECG01011376.1/.p1 GENE.gb/GECG01011376.1/~~gb/GECG01011376.1/.p1  ORF type:complete len:232 (+),score=26.63 gb/GECG01011376.1/:1-696(+)